MDGTSRLHALDGTVLQHGLMTACFAERTVVAAAGAVPLDVDVPLWQAALLGCGVVTGAGAVRNTAGVRIGDTRRRDRLRRRRTAGRRRGAARRRRRRRRRRPRPREARAGVARGATAAVDAADGENRVKRIRAAAGGAPDWAFEVIGRADTIRLAWDVLRPGGTAIVVGLAPVGVEVSLPAIEFLSEKSIRGCFYGSTDVADELPRLAGSSPPAACRSPTSSATSSDLDGVEDALERLRRGEGARTVLVMDRELAQVPDSVP